MAHHLASLPAVAAYELVRSITLPAYPAGGPWEVVVRVALVEDLIRGQNMEMMREVVQWYAIQTYVEHGSFISK